MRKSLFLLFVIILPALAFAQEGDKKFGIKFHGFVKTDMIYDSRQSIAVREGHFHLFPKPEVLDVNGNDINAAPYFNILSIQTRLKGVITGPDVLGAKTSALIEGAFFGHSEGDVNGFRLRHAFAKLTWPKTELLVGQYWHPLFITSCFPGTVSFNTGAPFQPFSRNPQVRFSYSSGGFKAQIAAVSQRDFVDGGPEGGKSKYLRDAVIPEMNLTLQYNKKSGDNEFLFGVSGSYKNLMPRISFAVTEKDESGKEYTKDYKTDTKVSGITTMAFVKVKIPALTIKLEGVMGQTTQGLTMLGGYYGYYTDIDDLAKGFEYKPLNTLSVWTDIHTNGKKWQFGVFGGMTQNQGSKDDIADKSTFYARGYGSQSIDYMYRISPRAIYNVGKMRFAAEIEYNTVYYGKDMDAKGLIKDAKAVSSMRYLLAVYYFF